MAARRVLPTPLGKVYVDLWRHLPRGGSTRRQPVARRRRRRRSRSVVDAVVCRLELGGIEPARIASAQAARHRTHAAHWHGRRAAQANHGPAGAALVCIGAAASSWPRAVAVGAFHRRRRFGECLRARLLARARTRAAHGCGVAQALTRCRPVVARLVPIGLSSLARGALQRGSRPLCLLYTSPSPRDGLLSRMPSSA